MTSITTAMPTTISTIELYDMLKPKLGEREAKSLVEFVSAEVDQKFEVQKEVLATKSDIEKLSEKLTDKIDSQFRWLIALFIGQMGFVMAIVYFILSYK